MGDGHKSKIFWTIVLLSSALAAIVWFLAPVIANSFDEPGVQPIIRWLVPCLVFGALESVPVSLLRRELNFRSLALRSLISAPIAGVIGIIFALLGFGVWSLVARILTASAIQTIVLWLKTDWRPRLAFSLPHLRDLLPFGINVTGAALLTFASRQLDVLLIGQMLGAGPLGFYTVAKRLVILLVEFIGGTIEHVAWPIFSRIQHDHERVISTFHRATQYASLIAFPVFTGIAILADSIVPVVFGEQWLSSAKLMQVLAITGLVQSVLRVHETLLVGMGRPQLKLRLQLLLAVANLIAFVFAIRFGLLAVTIGYAFVALALAPFWVMCVRSIIALDTLQYLKDYRSAAAGTAVMAIFIMSVNYFPQLVGTSLGALAVQLIIGFLSYSLTIVIIQREIVEDISSILFRRRNSNR